MRELETAKQFVSGCGSLPRMSLECDRKLASSGAPGQFLGALPQAPLRGILLESPVNPPSAWMLTIYPIQSCSHH